MLISTRVAPWEGLGLHSVQPKTAIAALNDVGMNWLVEPRPVFTNLGYEEYPSTQKSFDEIARYKANVRSDNNHVLGVVSDKYQIVQNYEAFSFLDHMIPEGLDIIKGGIINEKKVWLVGKFTNKSINVGGDDIDIYAVFTNSHDGKGSVRVCITPIRVACQNALSLAFKSSFRSWSVSHVGNVQERLYTAEQAMIYTAKYVQDLQNTGLTLKGLKITDPMLDALLEGLFPLPNGYTEQKEKVIMERRMTVETIFTDAPDLGGNTGWDFLNAVSDYAMHYLPDYDEKLYRGSAFNKLIKGHPLIDSAFNGLLTLTAA